MDRKLKRKFKEGLQSMLQGLSQAMHKPFAGEETVGVAPAPAEVIEKAGIERDRELVLLIQNHYRRLAWEIAQTLERIDDDGFGICEHCGEPIGIKRLQAHPTTTTCIDCQRRIELSSRLSGAAASRHGGERWLD